MFNVTVSGDELHVGFIHRTKLDELESPGAKAVTECVISEGKGRDVVAIGRAFTHPNDNFCKETGRKLSLTRALATTFRKGGEEFEVFDKPERTMVWQAYWNARAGRQSNVSRS